MRNETIQEFVRDTTTDLTTIRDAYHRFTWGKVNEIFDVRRYAIVHAGSGEDQTYHVYVDGKDTRRGAATLEGAMFLAMAHGRLEVNAADEFARACEYMLKGAAK